VYSTRTYTVGDKAPDAVQEKVVARYRLAPPDVKATPGPILRGVGIEVGTGSDAKRLSELEKKLDKLLEEVASLKKDREKGGR
jgi:hypothetical protein